MIKPVCDKCKEELLKPGGLAFSPPADITKASEVKKYHLCAECWRRFITEFLIIEWPDHPLIRQKGTNDEQG